MSLSLEPWIPAITAFLTLCNTIALIYQVRAGRQTRHRLNGLLMQHTAEAEARGRRMALEDATEWRGKIPRKRRGEKPHKRRRVLPPSK